MVLYQIIMKQGIFIFSDNYSNSKENMIVGHTKTFFQEQFINQTNYVLLQ